MNRSVGIILLAIICLLPGCTKYDDGPFMSLYSKGGRVSGTWYFQIVQANSKDTTAAFTYQRLVFFYDKDIDGGGFTWNPNFMAMTDDNNPMTVGHWNFISDRDSFQMVIYRNYGKDSTTINWKINRLAYSEFWLERNVKDTVKLKWFLVKYAY
jgi:hypothetical protein